MVRTLNDDEYMSMLNAKLGEELKEYLESGDVEELADLAEVMYAIVEAKGLGMVEFERVRLEKQNERGAFEQRLFIEEVIGEQR